MRRQTSGDAAGHHQNPGLVRITAERWFWDKLKLTTAEKNGFVDGWTGYHCDSFWFYSENKVQIWAVLDLVTLICSLKDQVAAGTWDDSLFASKTRLQPYNLNNKLKLYYLYYILFFAQWWNHHHVRRKAFRCRSRFLGKDRRLWNLHSISGDSPGPRLKSSTGDTPTPTGTTTGTWSAQTPWIRVTDRDWRSLGCPGHPPSTGPQTHPSETVSGINGRRGGSSAHLNHLNNSPWLPTRLMRKRKEEGCCWGGE